MSSSRVTSDSHRPDSSTGDEDNDRPPPGFCVKYVSALGLSSFPLFTLYIYLLATTSGCYVELSAHSISVSGANWTVTLVTKRPSTVCDFSLKTINGSLLHGDKVMAESTTWYTYQQFVRETPVHTMKFTTAEIGGGIVGDGNVVLDVGVEILASVKKDFYKKKKERIFDCDVPRLTGEALVGSGWKYEGIVAWTYETLRLLIPSRFGPQSRLIVSSKLLSGILLSEDDTALRVRVLLPRMRKGL